MLKKIKKAVFKFKPFSKKQLKVLTWWLPESPVSDKDGISPWEVSGHRFVPKIWIFVEFKPWLILFKVLLLGVVRDFSIFEIVSDHISILVAKFIMI